MREAHSIAVQEIKRKDCYGTLITFCRTLLEYSMRGSPCAKTVPHKQRKGLLGMDSKENKPRRSTAGKTRSPPLSHLCGPVCGFCRESKETIPRSHASPCWAVFAGRLERRGFSSQCGSSGARWDQNPMHKSAASDKFHDPFQKPDSPKNWGDTWGRK